MHRHSTSGLLALLSIAAATSLVLSAQTTTLRLVSTPWAPFTNDSEPRFALDLVEAALGRIGMKATTTIVEPGRRTIDVTRSILRASSPNSDGSRMKVGKLV